MDAPNSYSTGYLRTQIQQCDDLGDFQSRILPVLPNERKAWAEKITAILAENQYTRETFAKLCQVSRPAVSKWCKGALPSGREDYIKIGFAAHYNLEEMNFFLQRYGKYPCLYPKSLEDSVVIFVLNSDTYPHTYQFCQDVIARIKDSFLETGAQGNAYETPQLENHLRHMESLDELTTFITENAASFRDAYTKFYAYVNAFLLANNKDPVSEKADSVHALAKRQGWTSSLRQSVSAIRQKKWFPLRRKVIALGLHLNMTTEQINNMLQLAGMETLCAKNPVESAILFAVEDADLNDLICCDGEMELCDHVREVLDKLDIPDAEQLLNDI